MIFTDYIKKEHDNDMYVHLLEKKNKNILHVDIHDSSCGNQLLTTDA